MKNRALVYIFLTLSITIFLYLICSWTLFTTTKTINIPGEGVYSGQLKTGKFHGEGTWKSEMGFTYKGNFYKGKYEGQGILTFPNGTTYTGEFKDGYINGYGKMTFPDGHIREGLWNPDDIDIQRVVDLDHMH